MNAELRVAMAAFRGAYPHDEYRLLAPSYSYGLRLRPFDSRTESAADLARQRILSETTTETRR